MTKQIVLATFGTLGDIYPFIAVALALQARGFEPIIAAPEIYAKTIRSEGVAFSAMRPDDKDITAALGVDHRGLYRLMLKNPHFILDEIYLRFLRETYEDVLRACAGAHIILAHNFLLGAHQAAEKSGLPYARIALAPIFLQSAVAPSVTPPAPYFAEPKSSATLCYNQMVRAFVRLSVNMRMGRLRRFRKEIGLPPTREDFFLDFGGENKAKAYFGLFSPHFAPAQPDQPKNLEVIGFPFCKPLSIERRTMSGALHSFLSAGPPPVIFTLGSFLPEISADFFDRSIRAVRDLGLRAVLLAGVGNAARLVSFAGSTAYVCESAPHALLFPKGLCIVHHGGIGTTAEALYAGKPQIVVPFFGDQVDHGERISRLGLGFTIPLRNYTEQRVTKALQELISGTYSDNAKRFSQLIEAERSVERIADWVERIS
ncbi:glycosyltransferase [Methylocystis suflitae]|uniref:glycosyltransferase n=1 Tax=Methylocystis suflitae TaxID=2951405 RepID=UPI00210EE1E1|nr:glycosyltransferase [Methylocystis suflitae]MCQ4189419.1 glycosyltransferase [Methylocystis suflitae]